MKLTELIKSDDNRNVNKLKGYFFLAHNRFHTLARVSETECVLIVIDGDSNRHKNPLEISDHCKLTDEKLINLFGSDLSSWEVVEKKNTKLIALVETVVVNTSEKTFEMG